MKHRVFILSVSVLGFFYMLFMLLDHRRDTADDTQAQTVVQLDVVSSYDIDIPSNIGSNIDGVGSSIGVIVLERDNCPDGDFSLSMYDGVCEDICSNTGDLSPASHSLCAIDSIDDMSYLGMHASPNIPFTTGSWLTYREVAHLIWGMLIRYHPDIEKLLEHQRIDSMHSAIVKAARLYNIPWELDLYRSDTLISQRDFVYVVMILRYISKKPLYISDQVNTRIKGLRGYVDHYNAIKLIRRYVFQL